MVYFKLYLNNKISEIRNRMKILLYVNLSLCLQSCQTEIFKICVPETEFVGLGRVYHYQSDKQALPTCHTLILFFIKINEL
jgi:hypothetical protein